MAREDTPEARAWAIEQGLIPASRTRGTLGEDIWAAWDARDGTVPAGTPDPAPPAGEDGPPPPADRPAAAPRPRAERRPRDVPGSRPPRAGLARPGWLGGTPRPKKAKAKKPANANRPRVPVDELISAGWRGVSGIVAPVLPATARMMKLQAPMVGVALDPLVRDTVMDAILQPLARTSESAEVLAVVILPPVLVGLMESDPRRAPLMMPILRAVLLRGGRLAGPAMARAMRAEAEAEEGWGQSVDAIISLLGMDFDTPEAEAEAVYEAQQAMAENVPPVPDGPPDVWESTPPPPEFTPAQEARQAAEAMPVPDGQAAGLRFAGMP